MSLTDKDVTDVSEEIVLQINVYSTDVALLVVRFTKHRKLLLRGQRQPGCRDSLHNQAANESEHVLE